MAKIEFTRGDNVTHTFSMPTSSWSSGGTLFFTAKAAVDDDNTDAAALIDVSFEDSATSTVGSSTVYTCAFVPADTNSITLSGAKERKLLGQFQWVSAAGVVSTFPGNGTYIETIVYGDIKRATS